MKETKEMVRWRLRNTFSILPIFNDFLAIKLIKIPISLSKLLSKFPNVAHYVHKYTKMRHLG